MMRLNRSLSILSLALVTSAVLTGCSRAPKVPEVPVVSASQQSSAVDQLRDRIDTIMTSNDLQYVHWGVLIRSLKTGETWYEQNPNKLFVPASNQKIPTTAAALLKLGPDYRFTTTVSHTGAVEGNTLRGDLVVRGDGDPTLYTRFLSDPREVFQGWAKQLQEKGITRIDGNIVGDDNAWEDNHVGSGWTRGDEISAYYYAEFGPLTLNENYVDITIRPPATVDGTATLEPNLPSEYFTLVNDVKVVESGGSWVSATRPENSNVLTISGQVVAGSDTREVSPTITNPTLWYTTVLRETLEAAGIEVTGEAKDIDHLADWTNEVPPRTVIITHQSPPLKDIATGLMKRSQNMYAETMVFALGMTTGEVATFSRGREVLQEQIKTLGVEPGTYAYFDGSGLSRFNAVTPEQLVTMLTAMRGHELWEAWYEMLPIMGVDGTLRSRSRGTPIEGKVRAKTGTLRAVRGLSGYTETADGEPLVFSFLINGHLTGTGPVDEVVDKVLTELVTFSRDAAVTVTE
jgi:D-alanyl-D-alanine carboxypeptidase/D-alanyl-D-alanine-endopeptidase (penicillin-binding protein 4)